jgi:peptide chain release factor subunit 1
MISRQELERLASLQSDHGILSAYIYLDPRLRFVRQQASAQFKGAFKAAQQRLQGSRWQQAIEREGAHVLEFLANWEPGGRGLAIFSCRPAALWEALPLDFAVSNLVDIDTTSKTGALAQAIEEAPRFIVAILQRDKSQIYVAEQGTSERQGNVESEVPGQHKQGGRSQMRFQRHIDFHVAEHLKKVADELARLAAASPLDVILGGTEEIVSEMLAVLAEPVRRRVIGTFPVAHKQDGEQQILERAAAVWREREESAETKLLEQIVDAAKSGRQGVLGAQPTLDALVEEKVRTLLIADGLAIEGSVCLRCDYFSQRLFQACPVCGGEGERRDVADRAVEKAILTGASAEVATSEAARERLMAEGGLGALLRY